jgi:tRNA pseudouridine55 synthase
MDGYTLIDKPRGWTSFDVVAKVRGLAKKALVLAATDPDNPLSRSGQTIPKRIKVGHTGTLDPLATGLLVVLVGKYTKRAPGLTKLDKTYEVVMKLGEISTTGDEEGEKSPVTDLRPAQADIETVLRKFTGDIMQTPPIYSAMKINGVRAYKLAREGKEVVLEARPTRVDSLLLTGYQYPFVRFTAEVSSGTYIRSLVEDMGRELGTGAYMSDLRRTRVGTFRIEDARPIEQIVAEGLRLDTWNEPSVVAEI